MTISYLALYTDLLQDLSDHLPAEVYSLETAASADIWPDITLKQYRSLWLAKSFFKKFEDHTSGHADDVALEKFLQCNVQSRDWCMGPIDTMQDEFLVGLFKQELYRFFTLPYGQSLVPDQYAILDKSRTGPGSSIAATGTDFYSKLFSSKLSSTSHGLALMYEDYFQRYPEWHAAEEQRCRHYGDAKIVTGNRLSFVPKNENTSRVICTEPLLNMFFQLGFGACIEKRLKSFFGIDLSTQQCHNRELARLGSRDDSFVTIDLSSASDTVAFSMVKETFPRDIVAWLEILRSPVCTLPNGEAEELHMLSSMGNGFTFPIETLIFACVVSAVYHLDNTRMVRPLGEYPGNFGVFGDDIIVEKRSASKVTRLLHLLGFTVNAEKSFYEGSFRESCGGDYFNGHQVRGVYIKSLRSQGSRFVAINRLNTWSARSGIPLNRTVTRIMKKTRYLPVPIYENDDAGIRVPFSFLPKVERDRHTGAVYYRRWQSIPYTLRLDEGGITVPRGAKRRIYNPSGLLLAGLRGDVVNGRIGTRLGPCHYRTKRAVSPNWDWRPTVGDETPISLTRLFTAMWLNMY